MEFWALGLCGGFNYRKAGGEMKRFRFYAWCNGSPYSGSVGHFVKECDGETGAQGFADDLRDSGGWDNVVFWVDTDA